MSQTKTVVFSHLAMLLFSALVAGSFPIGARIANEIDPVALTFGRFCLAVFLIGLFLFVRKEIKLKYFFRIWRYPLIGGCYVAYFVCMFEALKTAGSISTAAIFTLMPFISICLDRVFFRIPTNKKMLLLLLVGAFGTLIIIFKGSWQNLITLNLSYGELIFFAGTFSHAVFVILVPKLRAGEPAIFITFSAMLFAVFMMFVIFPNRIFETEWLHFRAEIYFSILYLAIFATICTFTLLTFASFHLHSGNLTAYTFMTPFWVTVIESGIFGATLEAYFFQGGLLLFVSLLILLKLKPQNQKNEQLEK